MHPEVEKSIREEARKIMSYSFRDGQQYVLAAEAGIISFDDVYFMCLERVVEAHCISRLTDIINDIVPVSKDQNMEDYLSSIDKSNPIEEHVLRRKINLLAELYKCSIGEIELRQKDLLSKIEGYKGPRFG